MNLRASSSEIKWIILIPKVKTACNLIINQDNYVWTNYEKEVIP